MRTNLSCVTVTAIAVLATLVLPYAVAAQSIWLDGQSRKNITLEFYQPVFKSQEWNHYYFTESMERSGFIFFLSGRVPVSEKLALVGELPYVRSKYTYTWGYDDPYWGGLEESDAYSKSALGNPYVGVEYGGDNATVSFESGLRLPTLGEEDYGFADLGWFADFDRFEAFAAEKMSIQFAGDLSIRDESGLIGRARVAPCYWIHVGDECCGERTELLLHYSAQVGYEPRSFALLAGFSGVMVVTEEAFLECNDTSIHQLGFQGNVNLGHFRPGVHFSIPLDDELREIYSSVWGLSLQYQFD